MVFGRVMRYMIAVNDVVVPIPLALLQGVTLELEASHPSTTLLRIFGQRKLSGIVVPGAE